MNLKVTLSTFLILTSTLAWSAPKALTLNCVNQTGDLYSQSAKEITIMAQKPSGNDLLMEVIKAKYGHEQAKAFGTEINAIYIKVPISTLTCEKSGLNSSCSGTQLKGTLGIASQLGTGIAAVSTSSSTKTITFDHIELTTTEDLNKLEVSVSAVAEVEGQVVDIKIKPIMNIKTECIRKK